MNNENTLATLNGETLTLPEVVRPFCDKNGNFITAKAYLQKSNGLPIDRTVKLTDLKKKVGDKCKAQIKAYNVAKIERARFDAKVWALIGADSSLRKNVRAVINSKGNQIGFNGSARFTRESGEMADLRSQNEALNARVLEFEKLLAAKS